MGGGPGTLGEGARTHHSENRMVHCAQCRVADPNCQGACMRAVARKTCWASIPNYHFDMCVYVQMYRHTHKRRHFFDLSRTLASVERVFDVLVAWVLSRNHVCSNLE